MGSEAALSAEDLALLGRVAARVSELHLEVPALLTLESVRPLSRVAGQALIFFEPFVQALLRLGDYRRFAALVERADALEALATQIEEQAAARGKRSRASAGAAGKR